MEVLTVCWGGGVIHIEKVDGGRVGGMIIFGHVQLFEVACVISMQPCRMMHFVKRANIRYMILSTG